MPIFDQGYQHWQGHLAGHGWRWLAVTRHGIRVGMKNRYLRLMLLGALMPALSLAAVISLWGLVEQKAGWVLPLLRNMGFAHEMLDNPASFRITAWTLCFHIFVQVETLIAMTLVLLVGPSLISQDLRYNALPLYLSRPVRRLDYCLGKLGVIGFFLVLVAVVPAILAWVLGLFFSLDFRAILDTFGLLMGMVAFGIIVSLSAGLLMLAMSSLSRNSRYVAIIWAGMWFLTWVVSNILEDIHQHSTQRHSYQLDRQAYTAQRDLQDAAQQLRVLRQGPLGFGQVRDEQWHQEEKRLTERLGQLENELKQLEADRKKREEDTDTLQRGDWRPMISYTANLQRLGYALIGSEAAWNKVDELRGLGHMNRPGFGFRQPRLAQHMMPLYPWWWSALILLVLGGLSAWILSKRVTSLDRLR